MDALRDVERWPIGRLKPYARNARTHSEAQVAQLVASVQQWGWTIPILADEEGGVIAGHGRLQAAQVLGMAEVPVLVARGWSEAQKRAYVIADNKLAENAGWDMELLRDELAALEANAFDVEVIGFSDEELEPFSGSGSTLIAAEQHGRACYAMELTPQYVDVAVKRWQAFTGRAATLESDGRTFAEIESQGRLEAAA